MRLAFWILLLANLGLFAWFFQTQPAATGEGREPDRLGRQIQPELLRILPGPPPRVTAENRPVLACKRITGLSAAEADSLAKALAGLQDWQVGIVPFAPPPAQWVLIPALPSRAAAEKKRDELRVLGIVDHQVVEHAAHGPFAISFAMAQSEAAAAEVLQTLQRKGVRTARVVSLPSAVRHAAELRAPAGLLMQKLPELIALFAAASVEDCSPS